MDKKELEKLLKEQAEKQVNEEKHQQIKTLQLLEQLLNHSNEFANPKKDVLVKARQQADRFIEDFELWAIEMRKQLKPK